MRIHCCYPFTTDSMRFLSVLLLGGFLIFSLAACGGNGDGSGDTDADLQTVEDNGVQLELPVEVSAGAPVEVVWSGPDNEDDYISVAESGTDDDAYVHYTRTRNGSPLTVRVPDTPGDYEVRYVAAEGDEVLV